MGFRPFSTVFRFYVLLILKITIFLSYPAERKVRYEIQL